MNTYELRRIVSVQYNLSRYLRIQWSSGLVYYFRIFSLVQLGFRIWYSIWTRRLLCRCDTSRSVTCSLLDAKIMRFEKKLLKTRTATDSDWWTTKIIVLDFYVILCNEMKNESLGRAIFLNNILTIRYKWRITRLGKVEIYRLYRYPIYVCNNPANVPPIEIRIVSISPVLTRWWWWW